MQGYFEDSQESSPIMLSEISMGPRRVPSMTQEYPISPVAGQWETVMNPTRYKKEFEFSNSATLIDFINEVMSYQEKLQHHGKITITQDKVMIEVYTHDVDTVTELDQEYSHHVDNIFADVEYYHMQDESTDEDWDLYDE